MNFLRNALLGGIILTTFLLFIRYNEWQQKNIELEEARQQSSAQQGSSTSPATATRQSSSNEYPDAQISDQARRQDGGTAPNSVNANDQMFPDEPSSPIDGIPEENSNPSPVAKLTREDPKIRVSTDTLEVDISLRGGDISYVALPKYRKKLDKNSDAYELLLETDNKTYIAQSGLIGPDGTDSKAGRPLFQTAKSEYSLSEQGKILIVDLYYDTPKAKIIKRYTFKRDTYLIDIEYVVENKSDAYWSATIYAQIKRNGFTLATNSPMMGQKPYLGAALTTPESNYEKVDFEDIAEQGYKTTIKGGWVAMVQHYFLSAWVPNQETINKFELLKLREFYFLRYTGERTDVAPGERKSIKTAFYAGPKIIENLEKIAPHLDLTIDHGFLWFIAKPLFLALDTIHDYVGNWGIAIILLTLLIKLIFFYPSAMSYRSMAKMRKLTPMIADLKERYGEDRQKMSTEMMKLYKQQKVNPLGGCLPILLQMPVFIALYWVLMESVELRHAPFYLWIKDLSIKDPYFVLPLIMGATMWFQQRLNPAPPDPMQAKIMQWMPVFFTFIFLFFPAGLVLYWVANNTLSIAQQWYITRQIENADS